MRRALPALAVVALSVVALVSAAVAQPPDRLDSYRVVPSRSVFIESGPGDTESRRYPLRGEYDFLRSWSIGSPTEPLELTARFDNTDLRAPLGPMLPAFIDVGSLLNLEGIRGELLPQPLAFTPFEVFRFEGLINDSAAASPLEQSSIELYAVTYLDWMYLRGETTQPPWYDDRAEYAIRALARVPHASDANGDGLVDAADYTLLRDASGEGAWPDARGLWREAFGGEAPGDDAFEAAILTALAQQPGALTIPEPTAVVMAAIACCGLFVVTHTWPPSGARSGGRRHHA